MSGDPTLNAYGDERLPDVHHCHCCGEVWRGKKLCPNCGESLEVESLMEAS